MLPFWMIQGVSPRGPAVALPASDRSLLTGGHGSASDRKNGSQSPHLPGITGTGDIHALLRPAVPPLPARPRTGQGGPSRARYYASSTTPRREKTLHNR